MKNWPKVKFSQLGVGSKIAQKRPSNLLKSYLVIIGPIHMQSWPTSKLGQVEVGSNIALNR